MRVLSASLTSPRGWRWLAAALMIGVSCLLQAQAQSAPDDQGAGDPPSRAARLSYRTGDVGLLPAGEKDWGDASLNRPLTTGDRLSTGENARAELEIGGGTLRMADDSDFGFLTLNDHLTQVELTKGTLNLSVRDLDEGQSYEIDTPTVALVVDQPGTFRVDISDDGKSTRIIAMNGRATVYGEGNAQRTIAGGRSYEFSDSSLNSVAISDVDGGDDFDNWCNSRDQRYDRSRSGEYVSSDVVGYQDLDQYGNWQADPDYGQVWYPANVGADWAPYRDGHWAYVGPWGWSWVDDSPWGFAPYHYGRWAYVRSRWCWVPGPIAVRPVYAPALVAFVGGAGFGVSVGIGGGPVGWFPLGPGEVYNPWYRASRNYYTNVNITNIYVRNDRNVVINNINNHYNYFRDGRPIPNERYFNRQAPHAFTAMSSQDFAAARNAQRHMMTVDPQRMAGAAVMPRGAGVQPGHASFAPPRSTNERSLPTGGFQREVVARNAPMAAFAGRAAGAPNAPRPVQGPTQVRLLNGSGQPNRPMPAERQPGQPTLRNGVPAQAQRQPAFRDNEPVATRPGELPSARFARPSNGDNPANPPPTPRPGVSYIPSGNTDRAMRNQAAPQTLPNEPRFERAPPGQRDAQDSMRFQRDDAAARPLPQEPRFVPQPREVQQPREVPPQGYQPQAQPQQRGYEPPRGYEAPRANPAPQPRPENGGQPQQRPQPHHEDRAPPKKDEQQH
ncbi:DUF6600 domain-containing protein [Dyella sp. ASV21]|uniref:DUF6600 domain-containing protein n=1 Tax=Dyella sp. ASV21 TaxID=2795114 RepID=UPI001E472A87|nr:DUF6600 domain-containing protein [Dyella sp. ASV21]